MSVSSRSSDCLPPPLSLNSNHEEFYNDDSSLPDSPPVLIVLKSYVDENSSFEEKQNKVSFEKDETLSRNQQLKPAKPLECETRSNFLDDEPPKCKISKSKLISRGRPTSGTNNSLKFPIKQKNCQKYGNILKTCPTKCLLKEMQKRDNILLHEITKTRNELMAKMDSLLKCVKLNSPEESQQFQEKKNFGQTRRNDVVGDETMLHATNQPCMNSKLSSVKVYQRIPQKKQKDESNLRNVLSQEEFPAKLLTNEKADQIFPSKVFEVCNLETETENSDENMETSWQKEICLVSDRESITEEASVKFDALLFTNETEQSIGTLETSIVDRAVGSGEEQAMDIDSPSSENFDYDIQLLDGYEDSSTLNGLDVDGLVQLSEIENIAHTHTIQPAVRFAPHEARSVLQPRVNKPLGPVRSLVAAEDISNICRDDVLIALNDKDLGKLASNATCSQFISRLLRHIFPRDYFATHSYKDITQYQLGRLYALVSERFSEIKLVDQPSEPLSLDLVDNVIRKCIQKMKMKNTLDTNIKTDNGDSVLIPLSEEKLRELAHKVDCVRFIGRLVSNAYPKDYFYENTFQAVTARQLKRLYEIVCTKYSEIKRRKQTVPLTFEVVTDVIRQRVLTIRAGKFKIGSH